MTIENLDGRLVVHKHTKSTAKFHEFLLAFTYSMMSILLSCPSRPPQIADIVQNEGSEMREILAKKGIQTPRLISISDRLLIEEYIAGGDLFGWLNTGQGDTSRFSFEVGRLTGIMHNAGLVFNDNKAQNYLVENANRVLRTDLAFVQFSRSPFAQSMDVGSFLASVMGIECYKIIEEHFFLGYKHETGRGFPYLSLLIRNILAIGISSDMQAAARNMVRGSKGLLSI